MKLKNEEISSLKSEIEDLKNSKELSNELKSQLKIAEVFETKNKEVEELNLKTMTLRSWSNSWCYTSEC